MEKTQLQKSHATVPLKRLSRGTFDLCLVNKTALGSLIDTSEGI